MRNHKTLELEVVGSHGVADEVVQQPIAWGAPAAGDVMRSGKPWVSPIKEMLPKALLETVEKAGLKTIISVLCGESTAQEAMDDGMLLNRSEVEASDQISGVLNVISRSPSDVRPVLDAIAETAQRLCRAEQTYVMRLEDDGRASPDEVADELEVGGGDRHPLACLSPARRARSRRRRAGACPPARRP